MGLLVTSCSVVSGSEGNQRGELTAVPPEMHEGVKKNEKAGGRLYGGSVCNDVRPLADVGL